MKRIKKKIAHGTKKPINQWCQTKVKIYYLKLIDFIKILIKLLILMYTQKQQQSNKIETMDTPTGSSLMEEFELMKQAKYRVYMQNIDKALKNFEYSSEWADLISALRKLNNVISSYPQYQVIPRRIKISKRLSQCMHPALPSGVHLKALETYDVIFSNTGQERLACELFIYSSGLFPLLA